MIIALVGLFIITSVVYFIFVRLAEKKEEKFEKRKWWLKHPQNEKVLLGPLGVGNFAPRYLASGRVLSI